MTCKEGKHAKKEQHTLVPINFIIDTPTHTPTQGVTFAAFALPQITLLLVVPQTRLIAKAGLISRITQVVMRTRDTIPIPRSSTMTVRLASLLRVLLIVRRP